MSALVAGLVATGPAQAMTATGATQAVTAGPGVRALPVHQLNLHASYQAFLPKEREEPLAIHYAHGQKPRMGSTVGGICTEPACPLVYQGGSVQHDPKVYLLLWGPSWSTTGSDTAYLQSFLAGLGVQPNDSWSRSMEQYTDSTGHPTFSTSVLQGTWQDTSAPPSGVTQDQLAAEADAFYANHGLTDALNSQIVIATPSGTCPQGFYAPSCAGGTGQYCAWHSSSSVHAVTYTNLPYLLDAGSGCGEGSVNSPGTYDGFSIVEGHEFGETVTDPYVQTGWWDSVDSSGGENGDKCAWQGMGNVSLSTGSFAMQPLWSNSDNACVMSTASSTTYSLSVSKSGTGGGTVTSSPSGIDCGATCSSNFSGGTAVTLTATPASGSVFSGWSGDCTGTGTCSVTMNAAHSVTAGFAPSATSQETSLNIAYSGWQGVVDASANGGGYRSDATTGATAKFKFSGTAVSWLTRTGPDRGIASVTIDGVNKGTVDLYGSASANYTKTFSGLASATHTMVVKVTGTKNPASAGTSVVVDGFTVGLTTTQESGKAVTYNTWAGATAAAASGGQYRVSRAAGSMATFTFTGTGVDWITAVGPGWGKAEVFVDGSDKGTVDLYSATTHWQTAKTYTGLSSGSHTITIKALGTKNSSATSTKVPVDAFVVH